MQTAPAVLRESTDEERRKPKHEKMSTPSELAGQYQTERDPMQQGVFLMMLSALAFSAMTVLVKLAGQRIPSQEIVVARALVSLVLSWALLRRAGVSPWGHDRIWLWIRGGLGFAGLSCVYGAVIHLPLAEATVLQYLHPSITALFAGLFLGEAMTRRLFVATGLALSGVILVARPAFLFGGGSQTLDPLWVAVAVAGATFSAAAYVVVRRLSRHENPLVIVFYFPLVTLPAAIPTVGSDFVLPLGFEWVLLLGIGLATQIGQVSLTRGFALLPAAQGSALSYLQVVFATIWGILVFGERPDQWTLVGGGLVLLSSIWVARSPA
jgi:drug/metabolite transporter (DMT)-like permease